MARKRIELQEIFEKILGSRHVYYQPPENLSIEYPAIIYSRNKIDKESADNIPYTKSKSYKVTLIDRDPDSPFVDAIASLSMCSYDRHYVSNNLNYDVFVIYF